MKQVLEHDVFTLPGSVLALPGIHTNFDFSILKKEGEVFVIQKGEEHLSMTAGQDLVMTGFAGLAGSLILLKDHKEVLQRTLSESFLEWTEALEKLLQAVPSAELLLQSGVTALEPVGEGGVFASFWRLADRYHKGLEIRLSDIPLRQETVEICEVFDVNPCEIYGGGSVLLAADHGAALARRLQGCGVPAAMIGIVTDGKDRVIETKEGKRFVTKPQPDGLYEIYRKERIEK